MQCNVLVLTWNMTIVSFISWQAHKARLQTGDGFELVVKRANPKLYSSSCVEVFGTIQVGINILILIFSISSCLTDRFEHHGSAKCLFNLIVGHWIS